MTSSTDPQRPPGYRGALPIRDDQMARPWIITVAAIFVLIFVLAFAGLPSALIPDPTPVPTPSATAEPSASASADPSEDASADPSATASDGAASTEPSASASP